MNFRVSVFSKIAVKTISLVHTINYGVIKVKRIKGRKEGLKEA